MDLTTEQIKNINEYINKNRYPKNKDESKNYEYNFWNSQPIQKEDNMIFEQITNFEKNFDEYKLPENYEWVNYSNLEESEDICNFLNNNNTKYFYTKEYLQWYYNNSIVIGVSSTQNQIIGIIFGKKVKLQINNKQLKVLEVDLVVVHSKLRQKKLTNILIKELTRQAVNNDIIFGIFKTNIYIPTPIIELTNYYRPLNINLLYKIEFIRPKNITLNELVKAYELEKQPKNKNIIKLEEKNVEEMYEHYLKYINKYNVYRILELEEFKDIFLNKMVTCYLLMEDNKIRDFISYYRLDLKKDNNVIKTCKIFYYTSINETAYRLLSDLVIITKQEGYDLIETTDYMENKDILRELKFDKNTNEYINTYNFKINKFNTNQVYNI